MHLSQRCFVIAVLALALSAVVRHPVAASAPWLAGLPPQGLYTSCEIDTALSNCESEDSTMAGGGFSLEINYIGLMAHKTGANSLKSWLAYDARIGMHQVLNVKDAIQDSDPLNGTLLLHSYATMAADCGAQNNKQLIDCVATVADASPAFWGWYIYDEPGCPNQSIGYCRGSLGGGNYANVGVLAKYIAQRDPLHPVMGINTPGGGPPPCSGGWGGTCARDQINNLYSCNDQPPCDDAYAWVTSAPTAYTGYDYYPIGNSSESITDIGAIARLLGATIRKNHPNEHVAFVAQAFSWYQEGRECSMTDCPYPTFAQILQARDQALYNSAREGHSLYAIFYYSLADVMCKHDYSGCNATKNWNDLVAAAFSPLHHAPAPSPQTGRRAMRTPLNP